MNWIIMLKRTCIIILCFLCYKYSKYFYAYLIFGKENWLSLTLEFKLSLMLVTGICFALLAKYIISKKIILSDFGLRISQFPKGFLTAFFCVLPQLIGLGIYSNWIFEISLTTFYRDFLLAGFGEEFIFRAFLFGLLFFHAGWGFLSASIFTGLFFAWDHLYQASDVMSAISIFLFTVGASIGFSWFYYSWNSLWFVLFLHAFMDITWDSFQIQTNVIGNLWINIARFSTLFLAIYFSIREAKLNNRYNLSKNKKLWLNFIESN